MFGGMTDLLGTVRKEWCSSLRARLIVNGKRRKQRLCGALRTVVWAVALLLVLVGETPGMAPYALPSTARALSLDAPRRVLVASMALKGVTFLKLDEGSAVSAADHHEEWPTLHALAIGDGSFLLADRFGLLRHVKPGKDPATGKTRFIEVKSWKVEGLPTHLAMASNGLLVASGGAGLNFFEWKSPSDDPVLRGRYPFVDYTKEIALTTRGIVAIADNFDTGLQVIDGTDLLRPKCLAIQQGGFIDSVSTWGELAAIANRRDGTFFFDLRTPTKPREVGHLPLMGLSNGREGFVKSVQFDARGRLLICESGAGARLVQVSAREGKAVSEELWRHAAAGFGALDGIFLDDSTLALSTEQGELLIFPIK